MKYFDVYLQAVKSRPIDEMKVRDTLEVARVLTVAGVHPARVYAYCKTGISSSRLATPEWNEALHYFNTEIKELS